MRVFFQYIIISTLILFGANSILAQEDISTISYSGTPRKYEVAEIEIKGIENLDSKILLNISGIRKGQKITIPGVV